MPAPGPRGAPARKAAFRLRGKSATSIDVESTGSPSECGEFLHIGPALTGGTNQGPGSDRKKGLGPRAHSTLGNFVLKNSSKFDPVTGTTVPLQGLTEGNLQISRTPKDKDKHTDRINLDRRGLSSIPALNSETTLRLLSLQHNLLSSLSGLSAIDLTFLVFLDVYDNQIERISYLDMLHSLRVLLMGKNRIRKIEGLSNVPKLEVLDLHGNRITQANGLKGLNELKVLNLAGNQLKNADLSGLPELRELNLKRNRLRKLTGCEGAPKIQKIFLNNNDLQSIDDISSLAVAISLKEVTLDNNPISLGGDCISFLVSYLPNLIFLSQMQVTEQVRLAAMAWRHNKETNNSGHEFGGQTDENARREQVISNARTNWELLRSQSKCLTARSTFNTEFSSDLNLASHNPNKTNNASDLLKSNSTVNINKSVLAMNQKQNLKTNQKPMPNDMQRNLNLPGNINGFGERRVNFSHRSTSQDTDISHSTSTSSELLKLPPILVPILDSLEHPKLNLNADQTDTNSKKTLNRWESISSVDPVLNSSMSSLPTTTSESESEVPKKSKNKRILTASKKRASFAASKSVSIADSNANPIKTPVKNRSISDNSENMSVISTGTNLNSNITNSSTSGSDRISRRETLSRSGSAKGRYIKSATTIRKNLTRQFSNRALTAKPKQVKIPVVNNNNNNNNVNNGVATNPPEQTVKDREQGGDWLIEVKSGQASVWGAGALRRLEKNWTSANEVNTIHFHYVNFVSICSVLQSLKNRFPNAVNFTFRACGLTCAGQLGALAALRGISSLTLHKEGNPLAAYSWQSYALFRLAHWGLRWVDQMQVTEDEIMAANDEYSGLTDVILWSLPDTLLQPLLTRLQGDKDGNNTKQNEKEYQRYVPERRGYERDGGVHRRNVEKDNVKKDADGDSLSNARCWLWNADTALREVVAKESLQWRRTVMSQEEVVLRHRGRTHLAKILCHSAGAAVKLRLLKRHWPSILQHLLTMILYDFSKMQAHVDEKMKELMANLTPDIPSRRNKD